MLFVCHSKILHISIVFSCSWELKWPQEKLKTMLMQNFGLTNKEHYCMLWYFLEWSIDKKPTDNDIGRALHRYRRGHTYIHTFYFNSHYQSSFIELTSSREKKKWNKNNENMKACFNTISNMISLSLYRSVNQPLSMASLRNRARLHKTPVKVK